MKKRLGAKQIVQIIVLVGLVCAAISFLTRTPSDPIYEKRYVYFAGTLAVMAGVVVPQLVFNKLRFKLPDRLYIMFYVFMGGAQVLGVCIGLYKTIPFWDVLLHTFSGVLLVMLGFCLLERTNMSPAMAYLFAVALAVGGGAIWEIFEYSSDQIFGTNMQMYISYAGETLTGHAALTDTVMDLCSDTLGAVLMGLVELAIRRKAMKKSASV